MKLLIVATILVILISFSECKPAVEKLHEHDLEKPYFHDLLEAHFEFDNSHEKDILASLKTNLDNIKHRLTERKREESSDSDDVSAPADNMM